MGQATVVRYEVKPECAEDNKRLVEAVYAELAKTNPEGFRYATFHLDDGVTFLHIATVEGDNPLMQSEAFGAFQTGLAERCAIPPNPTRATMVGSYGWGFE